MPFISKEWDCGLPQRIFFITITHCLS